ncbi:hypothetical protein Q2T42_09525 [Leptolyngbya boryana CZ1]|uniref:Uncharacterized protein n=1 Tax=Leptolyngbya boryana CZ1 TaxID=3060204 RepID=A0AA97AT23_LEPBY|nr:MULTISPECIES: hypothetical protein [Leptolyngbya]MBD1859354.1 hypothetical protein [Leptolyngbya sp. FACHB-1624]MBN8559352.1 hypothetical protein [Leptolyngbya sp. UWPOB_LEPTO1]WNZ48069.1 hypothetical protein Q2T42_09525 [Leptolyngbya boryana CZ1]
MNRRWLMGIVGLICLGTVGYTVSIVAATPEEMLRRPFSCPGSSKAEAKDFQVLTVRKWEKGIVALSRGNCPSEAKSLQKEASVQPALSYRVVKRNGMEWSLKSTGSSFNQNPDKPTAGKQQKLIRYHVGRTHPNVKERHTVFYGEIFSPDVAAVEVVFDNGKVLRDTGTNGMLLLVGSGATGICDVRALGTDNQILQRDEPIPIQPTLGSNTCQPISGQL